jgi:hypothetical protein
LRFAFWECCTVGGKSEYERPPELATSFFLGAARGD